MRSSSTSGHNTPTATHTYSPSVPISVYRELATELQAKEAMLNSLSAQNQQLAKQNQQLRQEIAKAVQSVLHLQQLVDSAEAVNRKYAEHPTPEPRRSVKVFTEQEEGRYRRRSQPESASQISGWWLAIAILLIITTAFGAGYLIVRPLLHSRDRLDSTRAKFPSTGRVVVINKSAIPLRPTYGMVLEELRGKNKTSSR